jgi:hypothetical protein
MKERARRTWVIEPPHETPAPFDQSWPALRQRLQGERTAAEIQRRRAVVRQQGRAAL